MVYALLKGDTRSHITLKQYENDNEERGIVVGQAKKQSEAGKSPCFGIFRKRGLVTAGFGLLHQLLFLFLTGSNMATTSKAIRNSRCGPLRTPRILGYTTLYMPSSPEPPRPRSKQGSQGLTQCQISSWHFKTVFVLSRTCSSCQCHGICSRHGVILRLWARSWAPSPSCKVDTHDKAMQSYMY
jgi:hypothetical protein